MENIKISREELESLWKDFLISVMDLKYKKVRGMIKSDCIYREVPVCTYPTASEIEKAMAYNELEEKLFNYFCD